MGTQYLIDSNAVIDYLSGLLPSGGMKFIDGIVNAVPQISIITKIEVLGYGNLPSGSQQLLIDFINDSIILGLSDTVVNQTITLRQQIKIKLPDAIIASTALANGLELVSRNKNDFKNVVGLTVIDPHSI